MLAIEQAGAATFDTLTTSLSDVDLQLSDCLGLSCDGVSANIGKFNSVFSHLIERVPNAVLLKCICHSLALVMKHAFEYVPQMLATFSKESLHGSATQCSAGTSINNFLTP